MLKLFDYRLALATGIVTALVVASLFVGQYDIWGADDGWQMFNTTRIPRTVALVLSGAAMSMCGLVMQLLTTNKFVEPTTTGTTEWAGLGLIFVMYFFPSASLLGRMGGAILFAFVGTTVFFLFLRRVNLKSSLIVPIVGIMLGAVVSSVSTFFALKTDMLQALGVWFAGSFADIYRGQYEYLWLVVIVVALVFIFSDRLTVAGLGKDIATNVGLSYNQLLFFGTGLIAIATGIVTVVVGNLPFLGLVVPNIVSLFRGDDLRSNLPWVCLVGTAAVTIADLIGRTLIAPFEIPVSVILGVLGAVIFIYLIVGRRRV